MKKLLLFNFLFISIFCYCQIKVDIVKKNGEIININAKKQLVGDDYKKIKYKGIDDKKYKFSSNDIEKIYINGEVVYKQIKLNNGEMILVKSIIKDQLYITEKIISSPPNAIGVRSIYVKEKYYLKEGDGYSKVSEKEVNDHFQCGLKPRKRNSNNFKTCVDDKSMIKALQNQN